MEGWGWRGGVEGAADLEGEGAVGLEGRGGSGGQRLEGAGGWRGSGRLEGGGWRWKGSMGLLTRPCPAPSTIQGGWRGSWGWDGAVGPGVGCPAPAPPSLLVSSLQSNAREMKKTAALFTALFTRLTTFILRREAPPRVREANMAASVNGQKTQYLPSQNSFHCRHKINLPPEKQ